jgi:hypothetical protein
MRNDIPPFRESEDKGVSSSYMAPWIFSPSLSLDLSIHHGHRHNEALAERTDGEMQGRAEWANSDCRIMMILGLAVPTLTFSIKKK